METMETDALMNEESYTTNIRRSGHQFYDYGATEYEPSYHPITANDDDDTDEEIDVGNNLPYEDADSVPKPVHSVNFAANSLEQSYASSEQPFSGYYYEEDLGEHQIVIQSVILSNELIFEVLVSDSNLINEIFP